MEKCLEVHKEQKQFCICLSLKIFIIMVKSPSSSKLQTPSSAITTALAIIQEKDQNALKVATHSFAAITKRSDMDNFYDSLKQMVVGTSYVLQEKLWTLGVYKTGFKPIPAMKKWFIANTKLSTAKDLSAKNSYHC